MTVERIIDGQKGTTCRIFFNGVVLFEGIRICSIWKCYGRCPHRIKKNTVLVVFDQIFFCWKTGKRDFFFFFYSSSGKIVKSVIQEGFGIGVCTIDGLHDDGDKVHISAMSKSNECISGCLCITCFAAKNTVISIGLSGHHLVVIQKVTGFTELVGCRDFVINSCTVFTEHRIEPGCTGDFCHIIGCSVMFLIRKPVRIVEMRIVHPI